MGIQQSVLDQAAAAMGIRPEDFRDFVARGETVTYSAGDVLFHESTPRL